MFFTNSDIQFNSFYKEPEVNLNPTSLGETWDASKKEAEARGQLLSSYDNLSQVYEDHNKKVKDITGVELGNPARIMMPGDGRDDERRRFMADFGQYKTDGGGLNQLDYLRQWREGEYRKQLLDLADKHPDKRADLLPDRSFIEAGYAKRGQAEQTVEKTWAKSNQGFLDWAAWIGGQAHAGFTDPVNVLTMPFGFGGVGTGAKGLAMGFLKNGGFNAAIEVAQQPFIQSNNAQAGDVSGWEAGATAVGGAFLLGGALDTAVRGTARGLRYGMGYEPVVKDGIVVGYRRKAEPVKDGGAPTIAPAAPEADKSFIPAETIAKADAGDVRAIREVAERSGMADHPVVRQALDAMDANESLMARPVDAIPDADHANGITQALRHAVDPVSEPAPVVRVDASTERLRDLDGEMQVLQAEVRVLQQRIADGDVTVKPSDVEAVSLKLEETRAGFEAMRRQVYGEDLIDAVDEGRIPPDVAEVVATHVADLDIQGKVATDVMARRPVNADDARSMVAEVVNSPDYRTPALDAEPVRALDDPYGRDAVKQVQQLEQQMAEELGRKTAPPPTPEEVATRIQEIVDHGAKVRAAIEEVAGIVPDGVQIRVFSAVSDLPEGLAARVEMANAAAFAEGLKRFQNADSDLARASARRMLDDAAARQGIEGIAQDNTIWIASFAMDPKGRVAHEVVHALRTMGQVSPDEIKLLAAHGRESGAFGEAKERLYRSELESRGMSPERVAELLDEEAAAHAIEARVNAGEVPAPVKSIMDRVAEFFERVRNALRRQGFMTAEEAKALEGKPLNDVIQSFLSGEMAKRESVKAWMRQEDITAFAQREATPDPTKTDSPNLMFAFRNMDATEIEQRLKAIVADNDTKEQARPPSALSPFIDGVTRQSDGASTTLTDLYEAYNGWANKTDSEPVALPQFKAMMNEVGIMRQRIGGRDRYIGIEIVPEGERVSLPAPASDANIKEIAAEVAQGKSFWQSLKDLIARLTGSKKDEPRLQQAIALEKKAIELSRADNQNAPLNDNTKSNVVPMMFAFAGERAKTADLDALGKAKDLESQGVTRDEIWRTTGWGRGVDGKWRFEIDDASLKAVVGDGGVSHESLAAAYPDMRYFSDVSIGKTAFGGFMADGGRVEGKPYSSITVRGPEDQLRSVAGHELQHGVQIKEGFAAGGSAEVLAAPMNSREAWIARLPAAVRTTLDERGIGKLYDTDDAWPAIKEELRQRIEGDIGQPFKFRKLSGMDGMDEADMALERSRTFTAEQLNQQAMTALRNTGADAYNRLAGEVEARTVQKRMDLTAEERRARPFWYDYDVPESQQIVRGASEPLFAMVDRNVGQEMRRDLDQLGYFSGALEAAKRLKQAKGTPEQMLAMMGKSGAKAGEIEATGLGKFLEGKPSVTRDEIANYLEQNRLGLNKVVYGGVDASPDTLDHIDATIREIRDIADIRGGQLGTELHRAADQIERQRQRDPMEFDNEAFWEGLTSNESVAAAISAAQDNAIEARSRPKPADAKAKAKWSSHSLDPSNPTYRETVLHLPSIEQVTVAQREAAFKAFGDATKEAVEILPENKWPVRRDGMTEREHIAAIAEQIRATDATMANRLRGRTRGAEVADRYYRTGMAAQDMSDLRLGQKRAGGADFRSGHFDEPNIVGHMMTSMTKHEGKPVYTIDQIQSDWGQKLRDGGVRDEAKVAALKSQMDKLDLAGKNTRIADLAEAAGFKSRGFRGALDHDEVHKFLQSDKPGSDEARVLLRDIDAGRGEWRRLEAEYNTANASSPGHPLVNTTDQWTNTTLRRAIRQAAEADADYIAIPTGDTVLSYNPGDTAGMHGFYGSKDQEGIVPKNLRKMLLNLDKDTPKASKIDELETPSGMKGSGFTLFPLTARVKETVKTEGQPLFAMRSEPEIRQAMKATAARGVELPGGVRVQGIPLYAIRAYHGSPHDFDRFSMEHIGKGEGAQAYGHGLYFAENEGVARSYRDRLSRGSGVMNNGSSNRLVWPQWAIDERAKRLSALASRRDAAYDATVAANRSEPNSNKWDWSAFKTEEEAFKKAHYNHPSLFSPDELARIDAEARPAGRMYEVKINADPEQFLDWDKPLSQQSKAVRDKLGDVIAKHDADASAYRAAEKAVSDAYDQVTASNRGNPDSNTWDWSPYEKAKAAFSRLRKPTDNPWHAISGGVAQAPAASAALRERGIPGIRYLDQGSRGAGEGSRNYVVFDDALIEIVAKDGKPVGSEPQFAMRDDQPDLTPERITQAIQPYLDAYPNIARIMQEGTDTADLSPILTRIMEDVPALTEARAALSQLAGPDVAEQIELAVLRSLVTGESPLDGIDTDGIVRQVMDMVQPQQRPDAEPMFAMRGEDGRLKLDAQERAKQLQDELAAIEAQFATSGGDERLKLQAKRAALLGAQAYERLIDETGQFTDAYGRTDRAKAMMALIESFGQRETAPFIDLANLRSTIQNDAVSMIDAAMWAWRKGAILGDLRRKFNSSVKANMENVVRALNGEKVNDPTAMEFAKAWEKVSEYLRQRFNAAGGDIAKLAGWMMPQYHDPEALLKGGRDAWVKFITPLLDRKRITDLASGQPLDDGKLRSMLNDIWTNITTDGAATRDITDAPGKGALYKRHMEHRVLHFKDADAWLAYSKKFGGNDIYAAMVNHIALMSRDIALIERLGPNPELTMRRMRQTIQKEAAMAGPALSLFEEFQAKIAGLKSELKALPGEVDTVTKAIGDVHAEIDRMRDGATSKRARRRIDGKLNELRAKLGPLHERLDRALTSDAMTPAQRAKVEEINAAAEEMAIMDEWRPTSKNPVARANYHVTRAEEMFKMFTGATNAPINGTLASAMVGTRNVVSSSALVFAPLSAVTDQSTQLAARLFIGMPATNQLWSFVKGFARGDRRLALDVGLGLDQVQAAFAGQARMVGWYNTRHFTGYIADRTHAYSGLSPMTQASKVAFGLDFMRWMAGIRDTKFDALDDATQRLLARHGFKPADWDAIRASAPEVKNGTAMITRAAIQASAGRDLAEKYMVMLFRERGQAVLEGNLQGRTAWISESKPGTASGEFLRSSVMLKSFPTTYMMLILGRLYNEIQAGRGLSKSTMAYGASIFVVGTMLGALAKQLKNVGQGRDPEDMTTPKFWAQSFMQSGGAGIFGDFISSATNRNGSDLSTTLAGPVPAKVGQVLNLITGNAVQYARDEKTNAGREAVNLLRQTTPGMFSPWYTRLAYERLIIDEIQRQVDPEVYKSWAAKVRGQKKRQGNDFYWPPGGSFRAPNFGAAFGGP